MTIEVGSKLPEVTLFRATADGPEAVNTKEFFAGRKVVVFAVPGAFTPTCSAKHLPGFVANAEAIKAKGVDEIVCLASNDAFVMNAWAKAENAGDNITMLSDGDLAFVSKTGLELDLTGRGLGKRANRFAMIVDDGKVTDLAVEEPGAFDVSNAETVLGLVCLAMKCTTPSLKSDLIGDQLMKTPPRLSYSRMSRSRNNSLKL